MPKDTVESWWYNMRSEYVYDRDADKLPDHLHTPIEPNKRNTAVAGLTIFNSEAG